MLAYARLQCKNEFYVSTDYTSAPKEVLFEIRGRPHYLPSSDDFKCYFAMAQPYPSRNTAMYVHPPARNVLGHEANGAAVVRLNTFLELKMENERLQQRVAQLRVQSQALDGSSDNFFTSSDSFGAPEGTRPSYELGGSSLGPDADEDGPRKKVCSAVGSSLHRFGLNQSVLALPCS